MAVTQSEAPAATASDGRYRYGRQLVMEAAGNYALVFAFGAAIAKHDWFAPLLIGAALTTLVCFHTRVPSGHWNPALTLAMLMRGRVRLGVAIAYWIVQLGTGMVAAATVCAIVEPTRLAITAAMTVQGFTLVAALTLQLVFTCALCFLAMDIPSDVGTAVVFPRGRSSVFSVIAGAAAIAVLTGAFGSTVGVHDALLGVFSGQTLWLYLVSQLLSGFATTVTFVILADHC